MRDHRRPRRIVIAPDSFKGSLPAAGVAAALAAGWRKVRPQDDVILRPMADGGEGTLDAFAAATSHDHGATRMPVDVRGPDGRMHAASWLLLPDGTGVVELASTSGIELLGAHRSPWDADTFGFGQAIAAALDHGVDRLVLGIGSSASTDVGAGLLTALGARFEDTAGHALAPGLRGVAASARADASRVRPLPPGGAVVLTDVVNPLLGPRGAAAVFGPQKGLTPEDIAPADAALARFADFFPEVDAATPGAGAAGGTGFALLEWGATLRPGADEVAELIGLRDAVAVADVVLTGEGAFDAQSAAGKVPAFVARVAGEAGVPVALVAGRIAVDADTRAFTASLALTDLASSAEASLRDPVRWLRFAGARLAAAAP